MHNFDLEDIVIGCILTDKEKGIRIFMSLQQEMFERQEARASFGFISDTFNRYNKLDISLLWNIFIENNQGTQEFSDYLKLCQSRAITKTNSDDYVNLIIENYRKRMVLDTCISVGEIVRQGGSSVDALAEYDRALTLINNLQPDIDVFSSKTNLVEARMKVFEERELIDAIRFQNHDNLNRLLSQGLPRGYISTIAGRPGMGKSALRMNLRNALCNQGWAVCDVCTEPTFETETDRTDANLTGIPYRDIINNKYWKRDDPRRKIIRDTQEAIKLRWRHQYIVSRSLNIPQLRLKLMKMKREMGLDVVFIDLFDKMKDVNVSYNKPGVIGEKLGQLAEIALELNIHICLIVQINREVEKKSEKRPTLSMLKDSGSYEEVSRLVILCYREKYYNPEILEDVIEVNIAKQNNGAAGVDVKALYDFDPIFWRTIPKEVA